MSLFKKKKERINELKKKMINEALETGKAKEVYRVLIRDPWVGIKEEYWVLSEEQVKKWVYEDSTAYINCHYDQGQPHYSFVAKTLWLKWDEAEKIIRNPDLSDEEKSKALEKLTK